MFIKKINREINAMALFIIIISSIFLLDTFFSRWSRVSFLDIGPAFIPRLVSILLLIAATILIFSPQKEPLLCSNEVLFYLVFVIGSILLIYSIWNIGMIVSIYLYLAIVMYFFGYRPLNKLLLIALVGSIGIYYIFKVAGLYLPDTLLF